MSIYSLCLVIITLFLANTPVHAIGSNPTVISNKFKKFQQEACESYATSEDKPHQLARRRTVNLLLNDLKNLLINQSQKTDKELSEIDNILVNLTSPINQMVREHPNYDFSFLGAGGTAVVFELKNKKDGIKIAAKMGFDVELMSPLFERVNYFLKSIPATKYLAQSYLSADGRVLYINILEGDTLYDFISRDPKVSEKKMIYIMQEMVNALKVFHDNKHIHGDIKPENYKIDTSVKGNPEIYLIDYDLFHSFKEDIYSVSGTPGFIPPNELETEIIKASAARDLYALKMTFLSLVEGKSFNPEDSRFLERSPYTRKGREISATLSLISSFDYKSLDDISEVLSEARKSIEDGDNAEFWDWFSEKYVNKMEPIAREAFKKKCSREINLFNFGR